MPHNVIMFGPPGAGKGTQAEALAQEWNVPKISTGEILREAVQAETEVGKLAKMLMDEGKLVSDEVMIAIVRDRLARPDACPGFVLDGFPRTLIQARALDEIMDSRGELKILHVVVPGEELVRRVRSRRICGKCGHTAEFSASVDATCQRCGGTLRQRSDDGEEIVRERLLVYERETGPVLQFYQTRRNFFRIDGNQAPERVAVAIREAVNGLPVGARQQGLHPTAPSPRGGGPVSPTGQKPPGGGPVEHVP